MKGWLDKLQDGAQVEGTTNKGFNYNGAWGGPVQNGGWLEQMQSGDELPVNDANPTQLEEVKIPHPKVDSEEINWYESFNPKKWGLQDYSKAKNFNTAFRASRNKGEEEFVYKGERYKTDLVDKKESDVYKDSKNFLRNYYESEPFKPIDTVATYRNYAKNKYGKDWSEYYEELKNRPEYRDTPADEAGWERYRVLSQDLQKRDQNRRENYKNPDFLDYMHKTPRGIEELETLDEPYYFSITSQKPKDMREDGYLDSKEKKMFVTTGNKGAKDLNTTYVHELSHKGDTPDVYDRIPEVDLEKLNRMGGIDGVDQGGFEYLSNPSEVEARKMSTLYYMKKHGLPYKTGKVTKESLDDLYNQQIKDKKSLPYDIGQLLDLYQYQTDDLLKYLNNDFSYRNKKKQSGGAINYYKAGLDFQPKTISQSGSEIEPAVNEDNPILLDEVVVPGGKKGFWEQSRDKWIDENKGSLGQALMAPVTYPLGVAQNAMMYGLTGKVQDPSEAWGFENEDGWFDSPTSFGKHLSNFALDAGADPANLVGAGILTKENLLSKLGRGSIKHSIDPALREGLHQQGFLDFFKKKPVQAAVEEMPAVKAPWQKQDLPGLHLNSTMDNGPISKIVEPKTGLVNVEQALGIISKESGGAEKANLIKKAFGESIPKKMDFNDFRKTVQDQLIPLEHQVIDENSYYGVNRLGYAQDSKMKMERSMGGITEEIGKLEKEMKEVSHMTDISAAEKESRLRRINENLRYNRDTLQEYSAEMEKLPMENKTVLFSNKERFGKGSGAHENPAETLGHAHYLIDEKTPDTVNMTQLQSDAFQGTHRIMPKSGDPSKLQYALGRMEEIQAKNESVLETMKSTGLNEFGEVASAHDIKQMQEIVDSQGIANALQKGHVENFGQKVLLDKNHPERFMQEFVDFASKQEGVNKIRVPTSETAVKVQNYFKSDKVSSLDKSVDLSDLDHAAIADILTLKDKGLSKEEFLEAIEPGKKLEDMPERDRELFDFLYDQPSSNFTVSHDYPDKHLTILKKYKEQPKLIKKLFGQEVKTVTDHKGNTWYEFDIPEKYKKGKAEIKAFQKGGVITDEMGQWKYPGEITRIPSNNITMKGVGYPVLGVPNKGKAKMMYPGEEHEFPGASSVTEYPRGQNGVELDQLTNFTNYNTKQPGGWLDQL